MPELAQKFALAREPIPYLTFKTGGQADGHTV
jgi:hypothetical protein